MDFRKVVAPGELGGHEIVCEIRYDGGVLSIRGGKPGTGMDQGPVFHREMLSAYYFGWDRPTWTKFLDIWARWHLNDMRPGCEHQSAEGYIHSNQLEIGTICETCGHRFGSSWNTEPVPSYVINWLVALPGVKG